MTFYVPREGYVTAIEADNRQIVGYVFGQTVQEAEARAALCSYALKHAPQA